MEKGDHQNLMLIRLMSGEATQEEKLEIEMWINQSSANKQKYLDFRDIWLASGVDEKQYNLEKALDYFRERTQPDRWLKVSQQQINNYWKYAAILLLFFSLPLSYHYFFASGSNDFTTVSCDFGDRTELTLPDGSRVWLNSGSELRFNNDFQRHKRDVQLIGEAFFSVTKDKAHPFTVKTSDLELVVLGTEFNVRAYPDEDDISATLVEGGLLVKSGNQEIKIERNQKVNLSTSSKEMKITEIQDLALDVSWKNGRMVFRNESLGDLESKLEKWFDVDIRFDDDQVKSLRFSGTIERESILDVLAYFELSPRLKYRLKGNEIIFKSN